MGNFTRRMRRGGAQLVAAAERILSPEILLADLRLARKQIAVPVWRQNSNPIERLNSAWRRLPSGVHQGLGLTFLLLVIICAVSMPRPAYEISLTDDENRVQTLGVMHATDELNKWVEQIISETENPDNYELFIYPRISVQPIWWQGAYSDPAAIRNEIRQSVQVFTEASIIQVATLNEQVSLPVVNAKAANQVFDNVRLHYTNLTAELNTLSATFGENIYVVRQRIEPEQVVSIETATEKLLEGAEEQRTRVVQEGDSFWDYAMALASERPELDVNEALDQLNEANPEFMQTQSLKPGDTINLPSETKPLINVTLTETIEANEAIPFATETQYSDEMFRYESKVIRPGEYGNLQVQYKITKTNGIKTGSLKIAETVTLEPVAQIELRGTKMPDDRGTNSFIWPIYGVLTDGFGWRDLGYHRGQDISSGGNAIVVASDSGIVTQAGWDNGGLGYCITIDHRNGFVTRYAHLREGGIYVSVGDGVKQGQAIGVEGNTGFSFGTHLHFEIIVNGSNDNPRSYLP